MIWLAYAIALGFITITNFGALAILPEPFAPGEIALFSSCLITAVASEGANYRNLYPTARVIAALSVLMGLLVLIEAPAGIGWWVSFRDFILSDPLRTGLLTQTMALIGVAVLLGRDPIARAMSITLGVLSLVSCAAGLAIWFFIPGGGPFALIPLLVLLLLIMRSGHALAPEDPYLIFGVLLTLGANLARILIIGGDVAMLSAPLQAAIGHASFFIMPVSLWLGALTVQIGPFSGARPFHWNLGIAVVLCITITATAAIELAAPGAQPLFGPGARGYVACLLPLCLLVAWPLIEGKTRSRDKLNAMWNKRKKARAEARAAAGSGAAQPKGKGA